MKDILFAIVAAFKEILRWKTLKYVLVSGIVAIILWIGIGFAIWDYLIAFSTKILEYIPFAMVRSNGARMISAFIWFQLVLVVFALVYIILGNFLLRVVQKESYNKITFLTLLFIAIFWVAVWALVGDYIHKELLILLTWLPFETVEKGVSAFIALYILYSGLIVTLLFIASIFSEPLIRMIRARELMEHEVVKTNIFASIKYTLKDSIIFVGLSILAFPLIFVPIINLLVQVLLWIWLYKDTISHDALYLSSKRPNEEVLKEHKVAIYLISLIAVLFNFLPVLNIFSPFFAEIAMYYYIKGVEDEE